MKYSDDEKRQAYKEAMALLDRALVLLKEIESNCLKRIKDNEKAKA